MRTVYSATIKAEMTYRFLLSNSCAPWIKHESLPKVTKKLKKEVICPETWLNIYSCIISFPLHHYFDIVFQKKKRANLESLQLLFPIEQLSKFSLK